MSETRTLAASSSGMTEQPENRSTSSPPKPRDQPERFAHALTSGAVVIDTLANVLGRYTRRPEHKSLAPDGGGCRRHDPRPAPAPAHHRGPGHYAAHRQGRQQTHRTPHRRDHASGRVPKRLRHPGRPLGGAHPARAQRHGSSEDHRPRDPECYRLPRPERAAATTERYPRPATGRRGHVRQRQLNRMGSRDPLARACKVLGGLPARA